MARLRRRWRSKHSPQSHRAFEWRSGGPLGRPIFFRGNEYGGGCWKLWLKSWSLADRGQSDVSG